MKPIILKTILLILILNLTSCNKESETQSATSTPASDVFTVGNSNSSSQKFYYKNNSKTNLSTPEQLNAFPERIYVSGNDAYAFGHISGINEGSVYEQACYWKNGLLVNLTQSIASNINTKVVDITVVNGDVYAVGTFKASASAKTYIIVWKNGIENIFTTFSATIDYYAKSICVYNDDIYVSGYSVESTNLRAKFWKNGVSTSLSTVSSISNSIHVDQTGSHATISEFLPSSFDLSAIKYWKDGVTTTISTQKPNLGKMKVKGTDVYIAGSETETGSLISKACYWKNGLKILLSGGNTLIGKDIEVGANGDVFTWTSDLSLNSTREYWKNNTKLTLGTTGEKFYGFTINNK